MEIFPAIDIRSGKVVRLTEGDYDRMTVYSDSPEKIAEEFIAKGARNLHVVDLDGAKDGTTANFEVIKDLCKYDELFIEVGGGIRNIDRLKAYLDLGVDRTIIGTAAVKNYPFVEQAVSLYGDAVAVGVDAKNGRVAVSGWLEVTDVDSVEFCKKLRDTGVKTVIYTDISKDGTLTGTNLEIYRELAKIEGLDIVASGGITFEDEITQLASMNTYAAIVGKAIYSGKLSLERVLALAGGNK
ncbi:MAG: 1-(5-phosphoribosyl)-5-[(5-phosphoribosylamino)methylideneamino]imidazole-4-carboxamide isomerase [Clostridia bacterium]|nr:1-(5-phosphoribosyl)-5-[(5-phosphoribosylamino)methylideneamino]imidazole-4-carboxamide isomerase [Clostridia bacterium]